MINATIYVNSRHAYMGFDLEGHAGYSEAGTDVVCAAVSVLVINTINAVEMYTEDQMNCVTDEENGMISFRFDREPSHDAQLLIKTMILGLESMSDNSEYDPYIDIILEEV